MHGKNLGEEQYFWGKSCHCGRAIITLGWPLFTMSNPPKNLGMGQRHPPPPFWQCQDLESAYCWKSSGFSRFWIPKHCVFCNVFFKTLTPMFELYFTLIPFQHDLNFTSHIVSNIFSWITWLPTQRRQCVSDFATGHLWPWLRKLQPHHAEMFFIGVSHWVNWINWY